ncbi:hypothetical protein ACHAWO_013428 [Cyclotella atomus]|uniref:Large ribosomal subunit protein bL20c n=1 Tax=Cyclotella atomus TaxID=382360 RepID=A0ABD3PBS7_9STRA
MFGVAQKLAPLLSRSLAAPTVARFSLLPAARSITCVAPTSSISCMNSLADRFSSSVSLSRNNTFVSPSFSFGSKPSNIRVNTLLLEKGGACQVRGFATAKHKRVIKLSKGFRGRANRCYRIAIRRLEKSWQYAYRDRKVKKREFRKLWIQRLNAGVRQHDVSYSNFINMQSKSGVVLDRKILSNLAMYEPFSFKAVVDVVKMNAGK